MKRPLLPVAGCYMGGIVVGHALPLSVVCTMVVTLLTAALFLAWRRAHRVLLPALLFFTGLSAILVSTAQLSPHDLRRIVGSKSIDARWEGILLLSPEPGLTGGTSGDRASPVTRVRMRLTGMQAGDQEWQPVDGMVMARVLGELRPDNHAGRRVEVRGIVRHPPRPVARGLFDYRRHLARRGIHYQLEVTSLADWRLVAEAEVPPSWTWRFRVWAREALSRGLPEIDVPVRLVWAMTLGWRSVLRGEVSEEFMQAGTIHLFAISGLHITLVAGCFVGVLRVLRVPRSACSLVAIPMLWFYVAAIGWQPSAVRSSLMMSVIVVGWSLKRPSDLLNSLAGAAVIILMWDPRQLFQVGFQLSFAVVTCLALSRPILDFWRHRLKGHDPFLPVTHVRWWHRRWRDLQLWVANAVTVSAAAWLGSLPLVAHYFHYFNPVALLANVVIVPLSGLVLAGALSSLALSAWLPGVAELFNHSCWFWMWAMQRLSSSFASVPGGWWYVASPPLTLILVYYSFVLVGLNGISLHPKTRRSMLAIQGLMLVVLCWQWQLKNAGPRMDILPLSGGHAALFRGPQGDWLVDSGSATEAEWATVPYLKTRGINRLSGLLLTHGDARHVSGATNVLQAFSVARVCMGPVPHRSKAYRDAARVAEREGRLVVVHPGDVAGGWTVLYPASTNRLSRADDRCLVLMGVFRGTRVLYLSDLSAAGQNALLNRYPELRADVVVTGLPEHSEPVLNGFLRMVRPQLLIVCDAKFPAYARAGKALRLRLASQVQRVIYTRDSGAVTLRFRHRAEPEVLTSGSEAP